MMTLKRGVESKIELWDKRIVGDGENTQFTSDEEDYVWLMMFDCEVVLGI